MIDLDRVRAIFFDADDTLFQVKGSVGERYAKHLHAHGYPVPLQEVEKVIPIAWQKIIGTYENVEEDYLAFHERDKLVWHQYINAVMEMVAGHPASKELFRDIYDDFGRAESRVLMPYVKDLLETLTHIGIPLGVLTNNDARIHSLLPDLGLKDHFTHVYCASDIGFRKPSPKVFHGIAERAALRPDQILYIGDCPKNDIKGALDAGLQALWYGHGRSQESPFRDSQPPDSAPMVNCFSELLAKLER